MCIIHIQIAQYESLALFDSRGCVYIFCMLYDTTVRYHIYLYFLVQYKIHISQGDLSTTISPYIYIH